MAIIYADQVSELAIEATIGGKPHVNVLHYVNDEAAINDEAKARDILNNWQDHIVGLLDAAYVLTGARWRSLDRDDLNQGELVPDGTKPTAGPVGGKSLPPGIAMMIKKITNNRQRGQRDGRMFLGGISTDYVDETGTLVSTYQTTVNTALEAFISGVNDDAFTDQNGSGLVVLNTTPESRVKGTQEVDLTYRTVSAMIVDPIISTQRDRQK